MTRAKANTSTVSRRRKAVSSFTAGVNLTLVVDEATKKFLDDLVKLSKVSMDHVVNVILATYILKHEREGKPKDSGP